MSARLLSVVLLLAGSAYAQATVQIPATEPAHYPRLIRGDLPLYPPVARSAHISGTIEIQVTVEKGAVVDAEVKSVDIRIADPARRAVYDEEAKMKAGQSLSNPSLANVKTWQFQSEDSATFLVRYIYRIEGGPTPLPENPRIELDLPRVVTVIARPFKPGCSDCGAENHSGDVPTIDRKNGSLHLQIPVVATTKPKH
jgi:hypothetical protein